MKWEVSRLIKNSNLEAVSGAVDKAWGEAPACSIDGTCTFSYTWSEDKKVATKRTVNGKHEETVKIILEPQAQDIKISVQASHRGPLAMITLLNCMRPVLHVAGNRELKKLESEVCI